MKKRFLLTSFDIWLSEQLSNSSNDLLLEVAKLDSLSHDLTFLYQLPVDVQLASECVIAKINELKPDYIICCGMAAKRTQLSVEVRASCQESVLYTGVDLGQLVLGAETIEISHDCGKFVCEGLYYSVLDYLHQSQLTMNCIFVHVPVLHPENLVRILEDFLLIINKLALL
ncbi:MAG: peptidase C15 [Goleter apudmare HA4340-LM2]|jgi:pyroglutamyl-peptidase|nr:peptidase C15 [Goleter apudmare HA4340-LM2]